MARKTKQGFRDFTDYKAKKTRESSGCFLGHTWTEWRDSFQGYCEMRKCRVCGETEEVDKFS